MHTRDRRSLLYYCHRWLGGRWLRQQGSGGGSGFATSADNGCRSPLDRTGRSPEWPASCKVHPASYGCRFVPNRTGESPADCVLPFHAAPRLGHATMGVGRPPPSAAMDGNSLRACAAQGLNACGSGHQNEQRRVEAHWTLRICFDICLIFVFR